MAYFVFLCEHRQEMLFYVLERRYMIGSGRKQLSPRCRIVSKEKKIN